MSSHALQLLNHHSLYFCNFRSLSPGDAILRTSWGHIFRGYKNWVFVKTWDSVSRDAILQTSRRPYPKTFKKLGFYKTLSLCQETTSCRPVGVPILRLLKLGFWEKLESVSADANLRTSRGPYPKSFFKLWFLENLEASVPKTPSCGPAGGHILRPFKTRLFGKLKKECVPRRHLSDQQRGHIIRLLKARF